MANIGEVVAALRQATELLPFTQLTEALEAAEEAKAFLERATEGSSQADVLQTLEWFERAIDGICDLQQHLTVTQQNINALANRWEGQGAPSPSAQPPPAPRPKPQVDKLLAELPVRGPHNRKTSGTWIDDAGREHRGLVSGRDDLYATAVRVLAELGLSPLRGTLTTTDHVEVKLAASLRGSSISRATLVINNQPCDVGRLSCDQLLPRILRPGQTLTIHWPNGKQTYTGRKP